MRDRVQKFTDLGIQLLTVIAHDTHFVQRISGARMPKSCPYPLLVDPTATVSATYGAAFQAKARTLWSNRQLTFIIDPTGVIRARYEGDSPRLSCMAGPVELRGGKGSDLLTSVVDLLAQRRSIERLQADGDERLQQAASLVLQPIGPAARAEVVALMDALTSDDELIRRGASAALSWLAPVAEEAVPALTTAVSDENVDIRRLAITALGRIGSAAKPAIPQLVQALGEDDADARAAALLALRRFGPAATPGLERGLKHNNPRVRIGSLSLLPDGSFTVDQRHPDRRVRTLSLRHKAHVKDGDLVHVRGLTHLVALDLTGTSITDRGMVHLKAIKNLEVLHLGPRTGDDALAQLKHLKNIRHLTVGRRTTDAGLAHVSHFADLRELVAGRTRISGAGLAHLKSLVHLHTLRLRESPLKDGGLVHLRGMKLRKLQLGKTRITDSGLAHLKHLPTLETLNLRAEGKQITDAGIAHLEQVTSLKLVQLGSGTSVTRTSRRSLQKALPDASIGN